MKGDGVRRSIGLIAGVALIAIGSLEIRLDRSNYEGPRVQIFCRAGLCADQFSLERVFEVAQKASLGDPQGELLDFQRGIRLNPASAYRWADLGDAEVNVRDYKLADYAYSRAIAAGPRSPVIRMRAANAYFEMGNTAQVIPNVGAVLLDPGLFDYDDSAFLTLSRLGIPIGEILRGGIPQRKDIVSGLLTFLTRINRMDDATATWHWANDHELADAASTGQFFAFLVKAGKQDLAQELWQSYADQREPDYRKGNYVYNPGFESDPQPSPFDWTIQQRQEVEAGRTQDSAYSGSWAFRLKFNGLSNLAYHQTYQDMVLEPGKYVITAMMKSEQITTDEGLRLHIFDQPSQAKLNIWSDTVLGNKDWTKVEKQFEVPADIRLVRLEIGRLQSTMFDNKIGGTTWIDDIRLSRQ